VTDTDCIKNLLTDYKTLKQQEKITGKKCEDLIYMDKCLAVLEDFERDIVKKTYIDGVSMRSYAKRVGLPRTTLMRIREKVVTTLTRFFKLRMQ